MGEDDEDSPRDALPALVDMPVDVVVATGMKLEDFAEARSREGGMANLVVTADQIRPAD